MLFHHGCIDYFITSKLKDKIFKSYKKMLLYVFLIFGFDYQITRDIKIAGDIFWLLQVSCCTLYILWLDEFSIIDRSKLILKNEWQFWMLKNTIFLNFRTQQMGLKADWTQLKRESVFRFVENIHTEAWRGNRMENDGGWGKSIRDISDTVKSCSLLKMEDSIKQREKIGQKLYLNWSLLWITPKWWKTSSHKYEKCRDCQSFKDHTLGT